MLAATFARIHSRNALAPSCVMNTGRKSRADASARRRLAANHTAAIAKITVNSSAWVRRIVA